MLPNEIRSGTPSVVRMLIGRSQTLPSLPLPHSRSVSNSLRRREPGFAPRMHGCGRRLPRCRRSPRLSAGTILARVAAAKSSRSAASIERLPGSPYRACCKEGTPETGAISSFSNPSRDAYDVVDDPVSLSPSGIDRLGREGHLLGHAQARGVQEREHPAHIVGHTEFSGCDRERGGFGGPDQIAGEHGLGCAAPNAALDHGHNRPREVLDLAHELAERVIPAERIATALGQLVDVVTG